MSGAFRPLRGGARATEIAGELRAAMPAGTDAATNKVSSVRAALDSMGQCVKDDPFSAVFLAELRGRPCYCKLFIAKSPVQSLLFRLVRGRALRSYDSAESLRALGVQVAEPLACLGLNGGVLLVTEALPGDDIKALWMQRPDTVRWDRVMNACGSALAELHDTGYTHGDTKWSNWVWGDGRLTLVDLDAIRHSAQRSRRGRDLARFILNAEEMGLPRADFEHFLDAYTDISGISRDAVEAMALAPLRRLRKKHRKRYGQRGHTLMG